ncbi:hypothetical protein TUM12370_26000 [Salmonella enterica subsp. enterica serovar Choleraesuis]|nr:hypothetical protein TUM12370_26000 [Salmonella enterica subsp. enterica serovar Choleraesuis]
MVGCKSAPVLSSRSITHRWSEKGVSDIEGDATHIERAAEYVKAMRYTGYIGIGFSAVHSLNEINEACSIGRADECTRKRFTEVGRYVKGTGPGINEGNLATPSCITISVAKALLI